MSSAPSLLQDLLKRAHLKVAESLLEDLQGDQNLPQLLLRIPRLQSGSNAPHSNYVYDLVLPYLLAYVCGNQQADVTVSADPFVAFPMANFLVSKGFKVIRETDEAMRQRSSSSPLTLSVRTQTKEEVLAVLATLKGASSKL
mmetsp:Transcript_39477/g.73599  ORF Transcript_39477/g.73599 Transcript_39477/m.73599 type:complete len:142 (-) Transcript_39477:143-568(-)